ncbi:ABC transporter ATP-binding protein [Motilimonas pumila]|nr:ABC transporter transmembrane domain-containing protein [Motilimonas pumila]
MFSILRRLVGLSYHYQRTLFISSVLMLLVALIEVTLPWLTMVFIDNHLSQASPNLNSIAIIVAAYVGLNLLGAALSYLQATTFFKLSARVTAKLRQDCFNHSLHLPMSHFISHQKGEMLNRLTQDVESVRSLFSQIMGRTLKDLVILVAVVVAMFSLQWQLALITLAFVPVFIGAFAIFRHYALPLQRRIKSNSAKLNGFLIESLSQTGIMQVFKAQARFGGRLNQIAAENITLTKRNIRLEALLLRPLFELMSIVMMTAIVLSFQWLPASELGFGLLFAFFAYLSRFFEPIINLMQSQGDMVQSAAAAERVFSLMDQEVEHAGGGINADDTCQQAPEIAFNNVSFGYEQQAILTNMHFTLAPGQQLAVVGPSGAGKTTLAHLLKCAYHPSQGSIQLDGVDIAQMQTQSIRRNIAMVEQQPFILSASIRENICLGQICSDAELERLLKQVGLESWLFSQRNGLDTLIDQQSELLSTGTKQLLAIARALCQRCKVIILDEASASLDPQANASLQTCLHQLKGQVTVVLIAHKLETLANADNILVMVKGQRVQWGSHQQLANETGMYQSLLTKQQQDSQAA